MRRIHIDGRPVTDIEVERRHGQRGVDHVFLHRTPDGWTLLTVSRVLRYDDDGAPAAGDGWINLERLSTSDLATTMTHRYGTLGWHHLLDAAHGHDAELHQHWAPVQLERDLNQASLHCHDSPGTAHSSAATPGLRPGGSSPTGETTPSRA